MTAKMFLYVDRLDNDTQREQLGLMFDGYRELVRRDKPSLPEQREMLSECPHVYLGTTAQPVANEVVEYIGTSNGEKTSIGEIDEGLLRLVEEISTRVPEPEDAAAYRPVDIDEVREFVEHHMGADGFTLSTEVNPC